MRPRKNGDSSSEDDSPDPFDDVFDEAVRDTNLDNIADRQLKELAVIQEELNELKNGVDSNGPEEDQQFLQPSNQEAIYRESNSQVFFKFFILNFYYVVISYFQCNDNKKQLLLLLI